MRVLQIFFFFICRFFFLYLAFIMVSFFFSLSLSRCYNVIRNVYILIHISYLFLERVIITVIIITMMMTLSTENYVLMLVN